MQHAWPMSSKGAGRFSCGTRAALSAAKATRRSVGIACNGAVLCAAVLVQDTADEKSWLASSMASLRQVWLVRPVAAAQCSAGC